MLPVSLPSQTTLSSVHCSRIRISTDVRHSEHFSVLPVWLDDADWKKVVDELQWAIHPVDSRATRIWFAFFPVKLHRALANSPNRPRRRERLLLKGKYSLADQVDSSAEFMYGHRYWPNVKRAVAEHAVTAISTAPFADQIREVARKVSDNVNAPESLLVGIVAVAFGSLQQVGLDFFRRPAAPDKYGKGLE